MKEFIGKKILVISDTHGRTDRLEEILKKEHFDALIFLGDGEGLEERLSDFPGCPAELYLVRGNNDYNPMLPESAVAELGDHRIYMTHGHRYHLYMGFGFLKNAVVQNRCDYCFFGHLHRPVFSNIDGTVFLNPGSLSEPRQSPHIPTYAVLICDGKGGFETEFRNAVDGTVFSDRE